MPNLDKLPNFKMLIEKYGKETIRLKQKPWSASVWCSMFSGKTPEEHGHKDFVVDGKLQTREDIPVDFIWELLDINSISVKALNVPFIVPPYNYNLEFTAPGNGVPITEDELDEEIAEVTKKAIDVLENEKPEVFIVVYTALDKLSHLHWGEGILLDYYKKVDEVMGKLLKFDSEFVIISDHGFCDYDKAPIRTLPKITSNGNEIKGDHHPDAILIKSVGYDIKQPVDVFNMLYKKYLEGKV